LGAINTKVKRRRGNSITWKREASTMRKEETGVKNIVQAEPLNF